MKRNLVCGYIYRITNLVNGKIYIGRTGTSVKTRFNAHKRRARFGDSTFLYQAIRKYGEDNFIVEELCSCFNQDAIVEAEIELIKTYNSNNRVIGYNMSEGGDGGEFGRILSDETKNKIRKSSFKTSKARAVKMVQSKIERGTTGKGIAKHSEDHKKKISKIMTGRTISNSTKKKMSIVRKGKKCDFLEWSDERKEIFSKKQREKPNGAKLDIDTVKEIKKLISQGIGVTEIGRRFNISHSTVSMIKSGKIWVDV